MCILLLKLPRERPSFSCDSPPFFHPRGVGVQESEFDRPNEPDSLAFGVSPHRLVGLLRLVSQYRLFATDKTVLPRFPTYYNVHRRPCHNAPVLSILWMPFQPVGGHDAGLLVLGWRGGSSGFNESHCCVLKSPRFLKTPCRSSPIF
jgi:hypothetical protein